MRFSGFLFAVLLACVFAGCATTVKAPEGASIREAAETQPLPYRQFVIGEELPGNFALVLFLHGSGERGDDNQAQLKHGYADLSNYCRANHIKAVLLFPQCPKGKWWGMEEGQPLDNARKLLTAKESEFKADRAYAVGLSMGGFAAWGLAAADPERFAAIIPVCGRGDPAWGEKLTKLPIFAVHGTADKSVPVKFSRDMVRAIWNAGGDQVIYQEWPQHGHNVWTPLFANPDTWKWLFSHPAR